MGPQLIDESLIRRTVDRARIAARRRINHNLHSGPQDNPHRFLNALLRGSYVAPHRHATPPKSETFVVLEGLLAVFCFDGKGSIQSTHLIGTAEPTPLPPRLNGLPIVKGIDLPAGIWHTITAISDHAVCLEIKPGPWDPSSDKEFAPWAPPEGDPQAEAYLARLLGT